MKDILITALVVALIVLAFKPTTKQATATPITIIPNQQQLVDAFVKQHPEVLKQAMAQAKQPHKTVLTVHAAVLKQAETPPLVDAKNNEPDGDLVAFQYNRMKENYTQCGGGFGCWTQATKLNGHGWPHLRTVKEIIKYVAVKNKLEPAIALAVAKQESGFGHFGQNKEVKKSPADAYGVMQLLPSTAKALGVNERNPFENIKGGVMYLKQGLKTHKGNVAMTAAGYNSGHGRVKMLGRIPRIAETQGYTAQVTCNYFQFKGGEI